MSPSQVRQMSDRIDKAVRDTRQTVRRCKEILATVGYQSAIDRASHTTEAEAIEDDRQQRTNRDR